MALMLAAASKYESVITLSQVTQSILKKIKEFNAVQRSRPDKNDINFNYFSNGLFILELFIYIIIYL